MFFLPKRILVAKLKYCSQKETSNKTQKHRSVKKKAQVDHQMDDKKKGLCKWFGQETCVVKKT